MDFSSLLLLLLLLLTSLVSFSSSVCVEKSCPLGMFCPINANCSSNTSMCVSVCNLESTQGNWSSGNCERVPEEFNYWLDSTLYEVLIPPKLNVRTDILNITLSLARLFHSDDEDDGCSGSGSGCGSSNLTFQLETDYPYFKFKNGDTSHITLNDKDNVASMMETCTIVVATSDPIPLGDYEMGISVTSEDVLQKSSLIVHVVEPFPSPLPPAVTCVEFEFPEYAVIESNGLLNVTLLLMGRTQPKSFNVTVITNGNGSSSAIAGVDFIPGRYNATFTAGTTRAVTSIPIIVDNISEETEQFGLRLYINGAGYGLGLQSGSIRNATAFIMQPNLTGVTVEFKESSYVVVEDESVFNVTVIKQGSSMEDIVVNIYPSPETARPRFDYSQGTVGKVIFTPGGPNEQTVQLSVNKDELLELNETYLLRLHLPNASITAGAQIGTLNQAQVTIINDDKIQVFFKHRLVEVKEFQPVIVPVGFSPQRTRIPFTVRVETFDLSPPDAQAGIDYQPLVRNITLSQFVASVIIQVEIIENNITDGNKRFGLRIIVPEETQRLGIELGTPSELNVTVVDDDVGDLEVTCFTKTSGDIISGHNIVLQCEANQVVVYACTMNNKPFQVCPTPYIFRNVDASAPIVVTVNATAPNMPTVSLTLTALTVTAELQMVDVGSLVAHLRASKNATFRCRLNDGLYITCIDGQLFDGLNAGKYNLTVEARGTENSQDIALYTIGPVVVVAGVNATKNEIIGACFGNWVGANCNKNNRVCEYTAFWRTQGSQVAFTLTTQVQGWLSIGFSIDNKMPHSDIIVGAADDLGYFVDDRYAVQKTSPRIDRIQNVDDNSAIITNGVTTLKFVREKITNDNDADLTLNVCRFLLFAWGSNGVNISTRTIQYHGSRRAASNELICFPSATMCPAKFDCGDPGTPTNGARNFSSTLEDSIVTYSCNPGYTLIGNKTRVCTVTAEEGALWKYDIPKCHFLIVAFASKVFNGTEASGSVDVEVVLSHKLPSNASVIIAVLPAEQLPVSATGSGVDFVSKPFNVTFSPGENNKSISIPVTCDNLTEGTETFMISFSVQFQSVPINIGLSNATAIITDSLRVMFNQSTYVVNEETGLLLLAITVNQASHVPFGIIINLTNTTITGEGFVQQIVNDTINAEVTEQFFPVVLISNNDIVECNKIFNLTLSTQEACKTTTKDNSTAQLINDDVGAVSLQMPDKVMESIGMFSINISLNATASEDIVLTIKTMDLSATAGLDYNQTEMNAPSTSSLTIRSGELFGSLSIEVIDDAVQEQNETFVITVQIQPSCLPLVINGNNNSTITIIDNEELIVEFSQAQFSGLESSNALLVTLNLLGGTASKEINVTILLSSSSATGGKDYDDAPLVVTFNAGDTTANIMIPIINDNIEEEDEQLNLTITTVSPSIGVSLGTLLKATAVIMDSTLPRIIIQPIDRTVEVNNDTTNIELQCMANGTISYTWEKQNGVIPPDAEGISNNTLTLISITPNDSGKYRCVANNEHGNTYSDYAIVIVSALPPVVNITPSSITASEGDMVTFICLATGVSASNFAYEWSLNGSLINGVTEQIYNVSVTADTSSKSTIGNYKCTVTNQYGNSSQSNIATLILKQQLCSSVTEIYIGFNITWNETQIGDAVEAPCTGAGLTGTVKRRCIDKDIWEEFNECIRIEVNILTEETTNLTSFLNNLTSVEVISKVNEIVIKLANLTVPQAQTQLPSELDVAVDILSSLNNVTETVINMLEPNATFFEKTIEITNNLLSNSRKGSWQQLQKMSPGSSQKLITNIEQFGKLLGKTLNNKTMKSIKAKENIVIKAEIVTQEMINLEQSYMFPDNSDNMTSFTGRNIHVVFPSMLLKDVLNKLPQNSTELVITNSILKNGSLPLPNGGLEKEPVSSIISSQLPIPVDTTKHHITLIFDVPSFTSDQSINGIGSRQQHTCEFYNHSLKLSVNQAGAWSVVGIELDQDHSNTTRVTCLSTHLTSFAVLLDTQNETQSSSSDRELSVLIYIGSGISLAFLIVSIIVLSIVLCKNKGKGSHIFIHLNFCVALALGLVVFIAGIENATDDRVPCVIVGAFLQYFFTSAICWLFCEGVMLYMMLVTVFGNKLNHWWFFFILGWGTAIPVVAVSLGTTHEQYGTHEHCWIETEKGALAAFIVPIMMIIMITCTFLIISLRILCGSQGKGIREKKKPTKKAVKDLFQVTVLFLPLLGITWIFGILAVNEETNIYAWIFAILNILLGIFIFVFHVLKDDQVGLMKKINDCYKSETFYSFYSGIRYYTVSRAYNNGRNKSSNGDHNVKISKSPVKDNEEPSTTIITFKPTDISEIPLEDKGIKKGPTTLTATNPLKETMLGKDIDTAEMEKGMSFEENTVSSPTNDNHHK